MNEALREYRRELLLHCLSRTSKPMTAGDLVEMMGVTATSELHPPACWRGMDASMVVGLLRQLESGGQVQQASTRKRNVRHGRDEPLWVMASSTDPHPLPEPPSAHGGRPMTLAAVAVADDEGAGPYAGMTRQQLYTLLRFNDEHAGAVARFMRDVAEINERFRRALSEQGMDLPT